MANDLDVQIVEEGWRNAVVKLVGTVDTEDMHEPSCILLSDFTNNDRHYRLAGLRATSVEYSITSGLVVQLAWNGATPQPMFNLSDSGSIDGRSNGGFSPDQTLSGYDGSINLVTTGFTVDQFYGFTILLRLVKKYR